jgi:hypothetical protein
LKKIDKGVSDWQQTAATNVAALTEKELRDRERVRVKYDLPQWLKERVESGAEAEHTSASQFAAFLLSWAIRQYEALDEPNGAELQQLLDEARRPSRALRFDWDLEILP